VLLPDPGGLSDEALSRTRPHTFARMMFER